MSENPEQELIELAQKMRADGAGYVVIAKAVNRSRYWVEKHAKSQRVIVIPAWVPEARALYEGGASWTELGRRFGVSESTVRWQVRGGSGRERKPKAPRAPSTAGRKGAYEGDFVQQWKPKERAYKAIAGKPQPHVMDAAQAYIRGEISRDEMVLRLKVGAQVSA